MHRIVHGTSGGKNERTEEENDGDCGGGEEGGEEGDGRVEEERFEGDGVGARGFCEDDEERGRGGVVAKSEVRRERVRRRTRGGS